MSTITTLLKAEEYLKLPDNGQPTELFRGEVITMPPPMPRHGEICGQTYYLVRRFLAENPLGRVISNDAGVITQRDPDTVRGPDIAFYSYNRVPRGPMPLGYIDIAPELVFEVFSPSDRWTELHRKVAEYLGMGVLLVCVLDERTSTATVFSPDQPPRVIAPDQELTLPEVLPDFRVLVSRFFEPT